MNMATALMSTAIRPLSEQAISESLCGTTRALTEACERIKTHRLRSALKSKGFVCSQPLDGWSLPDAVWLAICRKHPRLNCYPLGEIAERAIKKTFIALILHKAAPDAADARLKLDEPKAQENLRQSLTQLGESGLLRLFLSHYFFEACIDYLRRPNKKNKKSAADKKPSPDWSYGYHFSKNNRMISVRAEQKLRQTLAKQCTKLAAKFFPPSKKRDEDPARIEQGIISGFEKVFGVSLPQLPDKPSRTKPAINVIVGTRSLAEIGKSFTVSRKKKRFLLDGDDHNVSSSLDDLEAWLGRPLHPLVKDLLEIGIAVHMSDLYTRRGPGLERDIGMIMPVRHPALWSRARTEVEQAIASLGRDDFRIHFFKRKQQADTKRKFSLKADGRCVCLFSGGIDSVAGAAWALDNGLTPVLISHHAIAQLAQIQKPLVSKLERIYARELQHVSFYLAKAKKQKGKYLLRSQPETIMAQHLRSFFFLSLAAAVALESGISTIYVFENGPVALNPLFSEARVNTHTVHPHFLACYRALIKAIFGVELRIENPFAYLTKGEVTGILARPKLSKLLAQTSSCWSWFRVRLRAHNKGVKGFEGHHDGDCFPCIHRRTSVYRAGLWELDDRYLEDIFDGYPDWSRETIVEIADYLRFCKNATSLSDSELLLNAPDFSVYEEAADTKGLIEMYREHAREVIRCFQTKSSDEFRQGFASVLNR